MLERQRHQLILDTLEERTFASVRALTDLLDSSEATIRRDLAKLAKQGRIRRIRGGAEALGETRIRRHHISGSAFLVEREHQAQVKRAIARKAVELCEDGDSIIINGGSSTFMMGEFLQEREVRILTNSFVLAQYLAEQSNCQVTITGGEVYRKQGIVLSAYEHDIVQYYSARRMFMGTPGISEWGVSESDPLLVQSEQRLLRQAESLVVLADSSKLGRRSGFSFCPLDQVGLLITDSGADEQLLDRFREKGVEVVQVEASFG